MSFQSYINGFLLLPNATQVFLESSPIVLRWWRRQNEKKTRLWNSSVAHCSSIKCRFDSWMQRYCDGIYTQAGTYSVFLMEELTTQHIHWTQIWQLDANAMWWHLSTISRYVQCAYIVCSVPHKYVWMSPQKKKKKRLFTLSLACKYTLSFSLTLTFPLSLALTYTLSLSLTHAHLHSIMTQTAKIWGYMLLIMCNNYTNGN